MVITNKPLLARVIKIGWMIFTFMILIVALIKYEPQGDIIIFLIYAMMLLSFPSGLLASLAAALIGYLLYRLNIDIAYSDSGGYVEIVLTWLMFFIAGYWQWFIFFPRLWKNVRLKKRKV